MAKYVKLGDKAQSFSDPTLGIKIIPGQVVEETNKMLASKKFMAAKRGGHLQEAAAGEYEDYQDGKVKQEEESQELQTEATLTKFTKAELADLILEEFEQEKSQSELANLGKKELVKYYLDLQNDVE